MKDDAFEVSSVEPTYRTEQDTGEIVLKIGNGKLQVGEKKIPCQITAKLRFLPEPRIIFECVFKALYGLSFGAVAVGGCRLKFEQSFFEVMPVSILPTSASHDAIQCVYMLKTATIVAGMKHTEVDALTMHLYGFDKFSCHKTFVHVDGRTHTDVGYCECDLGEFRVVLLEMVNLENGNNEINSAYRNRFTHIAQITKHGRLSFTPERVEKYIKALGMTMSFMQGTPNFSVFTVGLRANDIKYESWPILQNKSHNHDNWFDLYYHPDKTSSYFEELYPLIFRKIADQADEVFWDRIFMTYCQANSVKYIPNTIILTQVALETISNRWTSKQREKSETNNVDCTDKSAILIRNFLIGEGIPIKISAYDPLFAERFSGAGFYTWDIVRLLSCIRNSYIHADNSHMNKLSLTADELFRVSQIFLLVLEYAILRTLGYNGYFRNRLNHAMPGVVERVPWYEEGKS